MMNPFDFSPGGAIPDASFSLAQLYDGIAYGADARARAWLLDRFEVVSAPRERLTAPLQRGDVLLRRAEGPHAHACLVIDPAPRSIVEISLAGGVVEINAPGSFVFVAERGARPHEEGDRFARRITDERGYVPKRQYVLRPRVAAGESERIDAVSLMVGMTLANAASRPVPRSDAVPTAAGDGGQDAAEAEGDAIGTPESALWPSFSHRGFAADTAEDIARMKDAAAPGEFNSPEHFLLGLAIQEMVDGWAKAGLISGGCFVLDSDDDGTMPLSKWSFIVPDRNRPQDPYPLPAFVDARAYGSAHWHWIVPDANRDASSNYWTPKSLATAVRTGKAVTLSIGDIVMLSGDLVGDFADFSAAAGSDWRVRPVNIAKGLAAGEPFAMSGARVMQFGRSGTDAVHDIELLMRSTSDYAALQKEVASSDKIWAAVRAVTTFLRKVRGPSGYSELLVLSRLMRQEEISLKSISRVAPWLTSQDYNDVASSVRAAGLGDLSGKINSDLFQMIVTNGWYAELAMSNEKHFSPMNWQAFEAAHTQAFTMIEQQMSGTRFASDAAPIPAGAIAQTAYGLHFLSDAFASGHMRTPRASLGKAGSLLSGVMHDFDNKVGLLVENGFGKNWRAFGDGHLQNPFPPFDQPLHFNREHAISAMATAMKQLHYHAQRFFADSNHPEFQAILGRTRGTAKGLLHDDAVKNSDPGDAAGQRDAWLKMDAPAKIRFLRKHQPHPLPSNPKWKSGTGNHPPLVAVDASGSLSIDPHHDYFIGQTLADAKLYELQLNDDDTIDFTKEALFALLAPDAALSWLGAKEVWLVKIFQTVRIERSTAGRLARWKLLPKGLP